MEEALKNMFVWNLPGEVISSLFVMGIILVIAFIIFLKARKADPLKAPRGILLLAEYGVEKFDGLVDEMMGPKFNGFSAYIFGLAIYLFFAFIFGLTGLPSPMTNLAVPLSLALITFILIHSTAVRFNKWKYFKRYVDPFFFFLPVNLLSMWGPLLSLTLRLFGNALSGWVLMSIVYWALENLSSLIFGFLPAGVNSIFVAPFITPFLHLYFDLFSGFIQTTVFVFLTMIFIAQEQPDDELEKSISLTEMGERS